MRWVNVLLVLLVNAVPLYGIEVLGWSIGTVLLLYWFENLLVAVFTCARIVLYRWIGRAAVGGLLREYAGIAFPFTLAHGVFVAVIVFGMTADDAQWRFSFDQFRYGALQMLAVLGVNFLADALHLRSRSSDWIVSYAHRRLGRVMILHLGILLGVWGMAGSDSPVGVLYVVIGLKTLWDLALGSRSMRPRKTPPRWLQRVFDRIARDADKGDGQEVMAALRRAIDARGDAARGREDESVRAR